MAICTLTVRVAWWVKHYIMAVSLMQSMSGMEPNWQRINYWIGKGMKIKINKREGWGL